LSGRCAVPRTGVRFITGLGLREIYGALRMWTGPCRCPSCQDQ
jgi:hypothetical protein